MNAISTTELMQTLGLQAKTASTHIARAPAAIKSTALRTLAALLRANVQSLQIDNAKDLERATANGLSAAESVGVAVMEACAKQNKFQHNFS